MEWTIPGSVPDEELSPWDEFALIDLRTGKVIVRITDSEMDARCPECGLLHDDEEEE